MGSQKLIRIAALKVLSGQITLGAGSVTNAMLAGLIAYNKLTLTGAIVGGDLAANISFSTSGSVVATGGLGATAAPTTGFVRGPFESQLGAQPAANQSLADAITSGRNVTDGIT